ncbi:HAD-IIIC family phosphatase [Parabacteroides sp.]|uniref:HAD-IIIC family phosphatase n=1 Tax=Parabacteroides sp. TaxID=1869337 RepID=UPI00258095E3|nr:HAD-IIIC family phosphatase [Parabacteroides sp.]
MSSFVYRNNTVEPFFTGWDVRFSGYDDISFIDLEADNYIWFYQVPFKFERERTVEEIVTFRDKLGLLLAQVPSYKDLVVVSLVDLIPFRLVESDWSVHKVIEGYNHHVQELSKTYPNVKVLDFSDFTSRYTSEQLFDWRFYFISQMGLNPRLAPDFSGWLREKMREIRLQRKKCLVLDLDNTLWGGILGEDGIQGIKVGGDYPGKAFLCFQEGLVELSKKGVILTVCSKNNERDVLEAWEKNPFIKLTREYISAYRINWQNKADNICELSQELNIGLDSFVFVDDNPTERELVRQMLPMVEVPDFPRQPYMLPAFLISLNDSYFKVYSVTDEDQKKVEQYRANADRVREQSRFSDFGEYLRSLDMELCIVPLDEFNMSRIAQMTQKTNQFNLTTRRYTEPDLRRFANAGWLIYCLSVKDKFGDNGITGAILLKPLPMAYEIDTLLLSCRILGKGIEHAFLSAILNLLNQRGIHEVRASYLPTAKNAQVSSFYDKEGFLLDAQDASGSKSYHLSIKENRAIDPCYKIKD